MKELITEEQADKIVFFLSLLLTVGALGVGVYLGSRYKAFQKAIWSQVGVGALSGPAIWIFWSYLYNPIENFYGLDSLKALKINFFIALGFGAFFFVLHRLARRFGGPLPAAKNTR